METGSDQEILDRFSEITVWRRGGALPSRVRGAMYQGQKAPVAGLGRLAAGGAGKKPRRGEGAMGRERDYICASCGYRAELVCEEFDCGMSGDVVTPVICEKHAIVVAATGVKAWDEEAMAHRKSSYPCPKCGRESPLWDRNTCPKCGQESMKADPDGREIMWD
jgi:ribosomal protein L37E